MNKINKNYLKSYVLDISNKTSINVKIGDVFSYLDIVIKDNSGNIVNDQFLKENLNSYLFKSERFNKFIYLGNKSDRRLFDKNYKKLKIERELNISSLKNNGLKLYSINEKNYGLEYVYEFDLISRIVVDGVRKVSNKKYKVYLRNYIFVLNENQDINYFVDVKDSFIL